MANNSIDKKCPLGWYSEVDSDSEDGAVKVKFKYLAHNRVDSDRVPKTHEMEFCFPKQEIIEMIPDEDYKNQFALVNRARILDDERWMVIKHISLALANDFEELNSRTRSTGDMYKELLNSFANNAKYQKPMKVLAKYEALLSLLKKPKSFWGGDVREMM